MLSSVLTCKHYARMERLARDKHSSLLRKIINYGRKSFIRLVEGTDQSTIWKMIFATKQKVSTLTSTINLFTVVIFPYHSKLLRSTVKKIQIYLNLMLVVSMPGLTTQLNVFWSINFKKVGVFEYLKMKILHIFNLKIIQR
jgi:hypothetical protein